MRYRYYYQYWYKVVSGKRVFTGTCSCKHPLNSGSKVMEFQRETCNRLIEQYNLDPYNICFADFKFIKKYRVG